MFKAKVNPFRVYGRQSDARERFSLITSFPLSLIISLTFHSYYSQGFYVRPIFGRKFTPPQSK